MPLVHRPTHLFVLSVLGLWLSGCYTATPGLQSIRAPAYAQTSQNYRSFADADALSAYLRYDAPTRALVSAHRGGPERAYPENALATFERVLRYTPALIECDIRMTADSVLVLMHDDTLDRTTTGSGSIATQSFTALRHLLLVDNTNIITPFRIPTVDEALAWAEGRTILTLDVKADVPSQRVLAAIERADAYNRAIVIVYSLQDALRYHALAPQLMLSVSVDTLADVEALLSSDLDTTRLIAFTGVGEVKPDVIARLHQHNIRAMLGTFGLIDERAQRGGSEVFTALLHQNIDVIATDVVPLAAQAVNHYEKIGALE